MIESARLAYATDGTPYSASYDDIYHSSEGGLEQARHVFLRGNGLPDRWRGCQHFTILETGFGLGLSFLATWQAWRADPQRSTRLHFISTELHPFNTADLGSLHAYWPELAELAQQLQDAWPPLTPGFHHLLLNEGRVTLTLLLGDALTTLPQLCGQADAIYLDGFAPQKNPQLWSPALLAAVTQHAAAGATLASWCVAGEVRSALAAQGWQIRKQAGFARKRHMLAGSLPGTSSHAAPSHAIVIGAGIAGCSMAEALARRGWQVTLLEQHAAPAQEASGNPAGLLHPMLAKDDNLAARFSRAAYLYALRLLERLGHDQVQWQACGILQIAEDEADAAAQQISCRPFPPDYVDWLDRAAASAKAGVPVSAGGWWFPHGAWVNPRDLCTALLEVAPSRIDIRYHCTVARLKYSNGLWHACDANGASIAAAEHLILANAAAASTLLPDLHLSLRSIRGQLTYLPQAKLDGLNTALCGAGYAIRTDAMSLIGASFVENDSGNEMRVSEHSENLAKLARMLPGFEPLASQTRLDGRVSFRAASHDRMPLVGPLPQAKLKVQHTLANLPRQPGLHALLGFGARGLSWAPLAAELLAARLTNEVLPLELSLTRALDPARHHLRWHRRNT